MSEGAFSDIAIADIHSELRRILQSDIFEASERRRNFLSYVVEETLAGRSDRIKAYTVATRVFGRGSDFDPLQDSIVRIEAGRLRRELENFYLKSPRSGGISITIPKGAYVPAFIGEKPDKADAVNPETETARVLHDLGPRILIHKFDQFGQFEPFSRIGSMLTRQVIAALTRFTEIFVYGFETSDCLAWADDGTVEQTELDIDYELFGTVTVSSTSIQIDLLLKRTLDGRFVWAHDIGYSLEESDSKPSKIIKLCKTIAGEIVRKIAERDGIMDSQAKESAGSAPNKLAAYQKQLAFFEYWKTLDPSLYEALRQDLEKTIESDPNFAGAHASLSMLYSNAVRYLYDIRDICAAPLDRAMELAQTAIRLAPNSSRAYHAKALAEWFSGMPEHSLASLRIARSLNPNDSEILAELGFRYAMRMDWDQAVSLIEESYERNPFQAPLYHMGLFLYHFAEGNYERALAECHAIQAPSVASVHVAAAAALSRLGRPDKARQELREAESISPDLSTTLEADLTMRQIHPELIKLIIDAIGRADPRWNPPPMTNRSKTG